MNPRVHTPGDASGNLTKTARKDTARGSGPGRTRRAVERTFAWLHQFKRLRTRYEIRVGLHLGLANPLQHHLPETTPNLINDQ
ncbi:hypothetical protein [Streptomyces sp. NRRL F-2664]|uniref:hypothetical protein n=1 Tax=Streptomyces sp. NRRL F-2664 TaxID=1463842 RepID=UPI00131D67C0